MNEINDITRNDNEFGFHGARAAGNQKSNTALLDLFAEELPEQHDLLKYSTVGSLGSASTFSTAGGCIACAGSASTIGTLG